MIRKVDRKTKRNRGRSGEVALELGLMLLPTLAIIFGFLDVGMAIFTWNTLQNSVREGSRYAITFQTSGSNGQVQSVKNVVSQWAMGFVTATATSSTTPAAPYVDVSFYASGATSTALTGAGANRTGNIVEVAVKNYPYRWMFPFSGTFTSAFYAPLSSQLTISVYSSDVLGGTPVGGAPAL